MHDKKLHEKNDNKGVCIYSFKIKVETVRET